jgi:hypothetical protein
MAITEAVTQEATQAVTANESTGAATPASRSGAATYGAAMAGAADDRAAKDRAAKDGAAKDGAGPFKAVPVWFFAFEGVIGASYDIAKSSAYGWIVIVVAIAVNVALARTVLRGRLKMAKALLRGRKTRKIALCLIALRVGVHFALGAIGVEATAPVAHVAFALFMCATTVTTLAVEQRIMLRALDNNS